MTLEQIRHVLSGDDVEARRRAVIAIGASVDLGRGPLLIQALGDEEWRVRKEAARVVCEQALQLGLLPDLVEAISQGENVGLRNAALEVLVRLGGHASQPLLDALPRVPEEARKFVIEALASGGDRRVVDALVQATRGDDAIIAAVAIEGLAAMGGPEAEQAMRDALEADSPYKRLAAMDGLNRIGAFVPWESLAPLLADRLLRRVALAAVGRSGRSEGVAPLLEALSERSSHMVATAALALAQLHRSRDAGALVEESLRGLETSDIGRLRELLREGTMDVRRACAQLLCALRDRGALRGVVSLAHEDALSERTVQSLRDWGDDAIRDMLSLFAASQEGSRPTALELACDLCAEASGDQELVHEVRSVLRRALYDPDRHARATALRCMTVWAQAADAPDLVELARQGDEELAEAAAEALMQLAQRAPDAVRTALEGVSLQETGGAQLTPLVAMWGGAESLERLQAALSAEEPATRKAAIKALATYGGERAAALVAFRLADESVEVQTVAARALGAMRDEQGVSMGSDALLLALQSESSAVRAAAASALGDAGERSSIPSLHERALRDEPAVALASLKSLQSLQDPSLEELLVRALESADDEVVKQALLALAQRGGPAVVSRLIVGLDHGSWDVRRLAAELLGTLSSGEAQRALKARLEIEQDDLVRAALEGALSQSVEETG